MTRLIAQLHQDEAGFIVSAELVLVATICVLGMLVGLAELALNINNELEDVGSAFQSLQQSYCVSGFDGHKGYKSGSSFNDGCDFCAGQNDIW
ncbi:MAG: branched-chain amino acid aminotransferase [Planctomycetaceae bacterium]|nr:branched-chain amino acid aminotransferase [Planctomycetaceae bacterium]